MFEKININSQNTSKNYKILEKQMTWVNNTQFAYFFRSFWWEKVKNSEPLFSFPPSSLARCQRSSNFRESTAREYFQSNLCRFAIGTLRSQIEGYTRLSIFRKFTILPAFIWAFPFINIQENFQSFCFFTYTIFFSSSPLLLELPLSLNLDKNSSLPSLPLY